MNTIPSAIGMMILFSICVQTSEGTTYAIVPYISPERTGMVAGLVGAGGNAGALIWNTIWRQYVEDDPSGWFWLLGIIAIKRHIAFGICKCLTNKVNGQAKRVPFMYQLFMLYLALLDL
jgi:NNP family nitrate/nitrite transporter-like MFS transporter